MNGELSIIFQLNVSQEPFISSHKDADLSNFGKEHGVGVGVRVLLGEVRRRSAVAGGSGKGRSQKLGNML